MSVNMSSTMHAPNRRRNGADARPRQTVLSFTADGRLSARLPTTPNPRDRDELVRVSKETLSVLPGLLLTRPDAPPEGHLCDQVPPLDQKFCPRFSKTRVRVVNMDTIDAAVELASSRPSHKPVCVLNMANAIYAGGGFRTGALAQEEALCYRSSLSFTLKLRYYPIPDKAVIYSPTVLVIRDNLTRGHDMLDCRDPRQLPVLAVVSAAAIFQPLINRVLAHPGEENSEMYADPDDRLLMAEKMRVVLRTAIRNRHRQIVLGALGCGAFQNPPREVSQLWAIVLQEPEFSGGWWEDVIFAVLSDQQNRNFWWFETTLDGLMV